jgi:uncharacterized membrane protein HdeD (DUF308 family)
MRKYWWLLALRGLFAILFGLAAFFWPGLTLSVLVLFFGAYVLIDGVMSIVAAVGDRDENDRWWVLLLEGLAGIAAGIIAFVWPGITAVALLFVIAAWAIATGVLELIAAIRLREVLKNELLLALSGALSIILGLILVFNPGPGALALIWAIGAYAILFGALFIYLGYKLRGSEEEPEAWQSPGFGNV